MLMSNPRVANQARTVSSITAARIDGACVASVGQSRLSEEGLTRRPRRARPNLASPRLSLDALDAAEPRSIGRRRPGGLAVVAGVDPVALVVPFVGSAISRLRHNEPELVIQEVRYAAPEPATPSRI